MKEVDRAEGKDNFEAQANYSDLVLGDRPLPDNYENFGSSSSYLSDSDVSAQLDAASTSHVYHSAPTHQVS